MISLSVGAVSEWMNEHDYKKAKCVENGNVYFIKKCRFAHIHPL